MTHVQNVTTPFLGAVPPIVPNSKKSAEVAPSEAKTPAIMPETIHMMKRMIKLTMTYNQFQRLQGTKRSGGRGKYIPVEGFGASRTFTRCNPRIHHNLSLLSSKHNNANNPIRILQITSSQQQILNTYRFSFHLGFSLGCIRIPSKPSCYTIVCIQIGSRSLTFNPETRCFTV